MPESIADITNLKVRERLGKVQAEGQKDVYFKRAIVHALNGLLVAVDEVRQNQPFYVVELKVHDDKHLLKEAMRALMLNFPMVQTTLGKYRNWSTSLLSISELLSYTICTERTSLPSSSIFLLRKRNLGVRPENEGRVLLI